MAAIKKPKLVILPEAKDEVERVKRTLISNWFYEVLPNVEELLCRGTRKQRREYADQLREWAEAEQCEVYTFASAYGGFELGDPGMWRALEKNGWLSEVMGGWSRLVLLRHWEQALRSSQVATLEKMAE